MPKVHSSELQEFVDAVCAEGGRFDTVERFTPLDLVYDTVVNEDLSPFSDEYFSQQLELYREIAGRDLDQETGELHPVEIDPLISAANPLGLNRVDHVGEHVRCLSTMLSLAGLSGNPEVLDLGAGHGLSSEIFAYSGCKVHAIDIDPVLSELSLTRARTRGFSIERSIMNFDEVNELNNGRYEAAFFFQSLHHCLRPWDLIANIAEKLKRDGAIAFAGEPVQTIWWENWGLRLDPESLFAARAHGWFESGWSAEFIRNCFEQSGFELTFFSGGLNGQEIGVATRSTARLQQVLQKAAQLDLRIVHSTGQLSGLKFHTVAGEPAVVDGQPGFVQRSGEGGCLIFGPYIPLEIGVYGFSISVLKRAGSLGAELVLEVTSERGTRRHFTEKVRIAANDVVEVIDRQFALSEGTTGVEIRVIVGADALWSVTTPKIREVMVDGRLLDHVSNDTEQVPGTATA